MLSLRDHRKGQVGLVFVLLILILVLGMIYLAISARVVDNQKEDKPIPLEIVDVDNLVGLTKDNLNLEGIEVRRVDNDFISPSGRGRSSGSSGNNAASGSSSSGFSSGGGNSDSAAPVITNISRSPSGSIIDNGSGLEINVSFNSNEFPINVIFELQNSSGSIVHTLSINSITNDSFLPLNYNLLPGLNEGIYDLFMIVSDKNGNSDDYFIVRIFVDFDSFQCDESQKIIGLEGLTNSHVELYNESNYGVDVCYDSLFGVPYDLGNEHTCSGSNQLLSLFDDINSHASEIGSVGHGVNICYGDLVCSVRAGSCLNNEVKIVGMFTSNNSHLEIASQNNYGLGLCCSSAFAN